jgi:transcription-repair coupling factor (superfamily II helicase)
MDFSVEGARDFAPERTKGDNVYDALVRHANDLRRDSRGVILACYSTGSRERLKGLLADHGMTGLVLADSWQEALGHASAHKIALITLPLDHGFTTASFSLLTEQDALGDRLVRRSKRRKSADAWRSRRPHVDHGIGRLRGAARRSRRRRPHDCVDAALCRRRQALPAGREHRLLSRYGATPTRRRSSTSWAASAWQARKAKLKEAHPRDRRRADQDRRRARAAPAPDAAPGLYDEFAARFPYEETDDQERHRRRAGRPGRRASRWTG